jgi:hypothetical protein
MEWDCRVLRWSSLEPQILDRTVEIAAELPGGLQPPLPRNSGQIGVNGTMVIADQKGSVLKLIGVFSLKDISFSELVRYLPFCNVTKVEFGFMPYWPDVDYTMQECETDPAFVRGITCDLGDFKFPELSVT